MSESWQLPILMPNLGTTLVTFSLWHVRVGERVTEGDRLAEVMIPGASFDVPAPASGVLAETRAMPNDPIVPGTVVGIIAEA